MTGDFRSICTGSLALLLQFNFLSFCSDKKPDPNAHTNNAHGIFQIMLPQGCGRFSWNNHQWYVLADRVSRKPTGRWTIRKQSHKRFGTNSSLFSTHQSDSVGGFFPRFWTLSVSYFSEFPANVAYQEFDVPENFPFDLRQYIPNTWFSTMFDEKYVR